MSTQIGVAIIGSGIFVQEEHLPAVLACPQLQLKAIYSRSLKSAQSVCPDVESKNSSITLYSDDSPNNQSYTALLSRSDIQAVIIALPIPIQPAFIKQALLAGKHVLAEKPIARDVASGKDLIDFYHREIDTRHVNFSVAEQFRFLPEYISAAQHLQRLGRVLGCRVVMQTKVAEGGKYYETPWRKKPEYQGGFLLDGGVHTIAGLRMLLGKGEGRIVSLSAHTAQLQTYLPPVDTLDAVLKLANGSTGTLSLSFGTTFTAKEVTVACERGVVELGREKILISGVGGEADGEDEDSKERVEEVHETAGAVQLEVFAWAKSLVEGMCDQRQNAMEALADVEIVEACLTSGEMGGTPVVLKYQT